MTPRTFPLLAAMALVATAPTARAQLRPDEVLVVYDSRIADSRAVAEYYAGSAAVAGGVGSLPGARAGVRVLNLATTGAVVTTPGTMSYAEFISRLRTPIRSHLTTNNLSRAVRSLVLTKGLPHRILDTDAGDVGDNPGLFVDEFNAADVTCASVDSELTLLWLDLSTGELGNASDSKADGAVLNPYWKSNLPIAAFTNANNQAAKSFTAATGPVWAPAGSGAARLSAGDMYLVCRLDGHTVAAVQAMIDRGQGVVYNVNTAVLLLDEASSNGVADGAANSELDNVGSLTTLWAGDDYEETRDLLTADGRYALANRRYNQFANAPDFFVGPRINYQGMGALISGPVALLGTYGSNHAGSFPMTAGGQSAATTFADSFNYAPGAIFNTIESYNGRDFGGVGGHPGIPQEQCADFISAGGTFAIGHAWEPLADTIPDNEFLATNYILGNLCWAEAAWTSIPCLSWMHVVIGDPLARPIRTSEDANGDGRMTITDLYAWQVTPTDINRSGGIDLVDKRHVLNSLRFHERWEMISKRP